MTKALNVLKEWKAEKVHFEGAYLHECQVDECIEALEKQIPNRPNESMLGGLRCVCGEYLESDYKFCPYCGNAIDWT